MGPELERSSQLCAVSKASAEGTHFLSRKSSKSCTLKRTREVSPDRPTRSLSCARYFSKAALPVSVRWSDAAMISQYLASKYRPRS